MSYDIRQGVMTLYKELWH